MVILAICGGLVLGGAVLAILKRLGESSVGLESGSSATDIESFRGPNFSLGGREGASTRLPLGDWTRAG